MCSGDEDDEELLIGTKADLIVSDSGADSNPLSLLLCGLNGGGVVRPAVVTPTCGTGANTGEWQIGLFCDGQVDVLVFSMSLCGGDVVGGYFSGSTGVVADANGYVGIMAGGNAAGPKRSAWCMGIEPVENQIKNFLVLYFFVFCNILL